jgi:uncharacterized membrane protein YheB (UPF0754 family)
VKTAIGNAIAGLTGKVLAEPLHQLIPPAVMGKAGGLLMGAVERNYPMVSRWVTDFLRRPEIHLELEAQGRIFIVNVLNQLNGIQRFFISVGQYDQTLSEKMPDIIDGLIAQLRGLLERDDIKNRVTAYIAQLFEDFAVKNTGGNSIQSLLGLEGEKKAALDKFILDKVLELADKQIENLLHTINIKTLVSDRIDALEMEKVERIVLDVMANQLKWINVFGGILGALIGIVQACLSRLLG